MNPFLLPHRSIHKPNPPLASFLPLLDLQSTLTKFKPLFDRVLVERFVPAAKSKGGILLPETSIEKLNQGKVIACGPGARTESGSVIPMAVKVGDNVLLPEFGGSKVKLENKEYLLFRDTDILGTL
eukprot:Sdes_comp10533_c0_seq1m2223